MKFRLIQPIVISFRKHTTQSDNEICYESTVLTHHLNATKCFAIYRVAIRPVFAGTVPLLGLGPDVPPSLPLCPGIFDSKFAFLNTVCQLHKRAICYINLQGTIIKFLVCDVTD